MNRILRNIALTVIAFAATSYVLAIFNLTPFVKELSAAKVQLNYFSELKTLSDVLKLVQYKYVEEEVVKDKHKLIEGGIEGILKKLDDPFTRYMPPQTYKEMQEDTDGEFGGLGIILGVRDNVLTIISPMEGTPAFRVGVRAGDKIVKINTKPTEGMSSEQAVKILRGKPGTSVTISVYREGEKELIDYEIVRDIIKVPSVKAGMLTKNIGYARLTGFVQTSGEDLEKEIEKMESKYELHGFILDLRGNPGGLLTAAVEVSQIFLEKGQTVVSIKGRHGDEAVFKTQKTSHKKWPLIILIDGGSASASEITAGAMKDNKRGLLLGTKSFGKGSVQTVLPLNDGSALALTTAYYYTPANIKIHKIGIEPNVEVKFPKLTNDELKKYRDEMERINQLDYDKTREKQDEYLNSHDSEKSETTSVAASDTETSEAAQEPKKKEFMTIPEFDVQLQRALEILKATNIFFDVTK